MTDFVLFLLIVTGLLVIGWMSDNVILLALLLGAVIVLIVWRKDRHNQS